MLRLEPLLALAPDLRRGAHAVVVLALPAPGAASLAYLGALLRAPGAGEPRGHHREWGQHDEQRAERRRLSRGDLCPRGALDGVCRSRSGGGVDAPRPDERPEE